MDRTNNTHDEINVMGPSNKLKALVDKFGAEVSDRFGSDDINIVVQRERCDEVTDYCEKHGIEWRLL